MNTAGIIVLVIFLLLIAAAIGWVGFSHWRARRLGLPPPPLNPFAKSSSGYGVQPAAGGVVGWVNDRIRTFRNRNVRTATGAYEGGGPAARSRGAFDPDDAWDARVGNTDGPGGYYEEQELGLHPQHAGANTEYGGASGGGNSYRMNLAATPGVAPAGFGAEDEARGRPRSRSPGLRPGRNPFDDDAEPSNMSMRGVSPRPIDTAGAAAKAKKEGAKEPGSGDSPSERRSVFRENM